MSKAHYFILYFSLCGCTATKQQIQSVEAPHISQPIPISQPTLVVVKERVEKERIAVLELKNRASVDQEKLHYLSDVLRVVASKLNRRKYSVMTEDNILVMLPPDVKIEDCQGTCAVTTGRNLGAHWVLVGNVVKFGDSLRITIRLHHTLSGEIYGSEQLKGETLEELEFPLRQAGIRLFSSLEPQLLTLMETLPKSAPPERITQPLKREVSTAPTQDSIPEMKGGFKQHDSDVMVSYVARISDQDKQTLSGKQLRHVEHIISQDRANVHRFNIKDDEDEIDKEFGQFARRLWLSKKLMATHIPSHVAEQIQSSHPLIRITILHDGKVKVELENTHSKDHQSHCKRARVKQLDPFGDNFLSVRKGPSSKYSELQRLHSNEAVCVTKKHKKWYNISYQRSDGQTIPCSGEICRSGWVFGKFMDLIDK